MTCTDSDAAPYPCSSIAMKSGHRGMAETTPTIAALPAELKQHIFSFVLLEGSLTPCLRDFLRMRLVCKAWNTAIQTGRPISFRVHIQTTEHGCDNAALATLPVNPYSFPLLANCHHSKQRWACALAKVKFCKSTWAAIQTHEQLSDMLQRLLGCVSGLKVEVSDCIANASRCLPVKPFIEAYEDTFSDENQQEQEEEEEDDASWLSEVVERAKQKTLPPLHLYKAVKTSGYINWGEGENDEGPYGYGVFTHLRQLAIAEDDKYFNTSFTACPRLECLRIESGSHMFDFDLPGLFNACTNLKHVSYADFDYHLPDADNFETAAYALESIGLSARGYVDPTSIEHFTSLLETNRAYLQSLSALKMIVVDARSNGGDIGSIPKSQKAIEELLESFHAISSLETVLFTNVCEKKHENLVRVSEVFPLFKVLLEYLPKDRDPSTADEFEGGDDDGDDDEDDVDHEGNDDEDEDEDDNMDEDGDDDDDDDEDQDVSVSLKGRTLVFTGTLSQMTRAVAAAKAKQCGASVASSVTKAVDLVVNAGDGGAKLEKARDQGIEIWGEKKFMRALETKTAQDTQLSNDERRRELSSASSSSNSAPKKRSLQGKTITFTGTLASMPRAEAAQKATEQGATVASSLTKAVNLVIASKSDGPVLEKARERGIDVWTEDEFLEVVNDTATSTAVSQVKKGKRNANAAVDVGELTVSKEKQGASRRKPAKPAVELPALSVSGRNLVFLGTFKSIKRADATRKAILLGANVVPSFTKVVDLVIAANEADEKMVKAWVQGIEVWDEETFMRVAMEDSPPSPQKSIDTKDFQVKAAPRSSVKRKAPSDTTSTKPAHTSPSKLDIAGRNIVFTGTLLQMKRAEATKQANLLDATVHSSFNKSVDLVVAGGDAGAKLDKARAKGVEIWDEQMFLDVLAGNGGSSSGAKAKKR
ncbi:hypothetical protein HDU81_007724 [Chytriomyces hyalinus]|nr:hypothetical protein HDU81_007724 [Chytriomyces hyalinus]